MVSKLAKALGFIGGIAAIIWAMRDRFISVAVSREPEPPAFKTTPMPPAPALESIPGIGPTYAGRLRAAGMETTADLRAADASRIAEVAGVSLPRAQGWLDLAGE